jgi:hypothetical protein
MLIKIKSSAKEQRPKACLSCGTTDNIKKPPLLFGKMPSASASEAQYAQRSARGPQHTLRDILFHGNDDYSGRGSPWDSGDFPVHGTENGKSTPADDFGRLSNMLGGAWWAEEKRTAKNYLASRRVLEMAERCVISEGLARPRLHRAPTVKPENLILLDMKRTDLSSRDPARIIRNAYRRQVKIHHPDVGGKAVMFRKIHAAYQEMLHWADHPTFTRRRGFPDKWYYDGENKKWVQPVILRK